LININLYDVINGKTRLKASNNIWDWLGDGIYKDAGKSMPKNEQDNRKLNSAVFKHLHISRGDNSNPPLIP
jgi:hypothetical protein